LGRQVFGNQYNSNFSGIYLSQDKCYEFAVTEVVAKCYIEATKIGDHFIVIPQTTDGLCLRMVNSSEISLIMVAIALINKKDFKFANIQRSLRHNDIILEVLSLKYYEVAKTLMQDGNNIEMENYVNIGSLDNKNDRTVSIRGDCCGNLSDDDLKVLQ
jgi:hypothetical protein